MKMSAFSEAQLKELENMFHTLGMDIEQQAHSDYTRNDAAREAVWNVAHAVQCFEPRQVEP